MGSAVVQQSTVLPSLPLEEVLSYSLCISMLSHLFREGIVRFSPLFYLMLSRRGEISSFISFSPSSKMCQGEVLQTSCRSAYFILVSCPLIYCYTIVQIFLTKRDRDKITISSQMFPNNIHHLKNPLERKT